MNRLLPLLLFVSLLSACGGNKQSELVTEYYYDQYGRSEGKKAQYMAIPGKDDLGFYRKLPWDETGIVTEEAQRYLDAHDVLHVSEESIS